MEQKLQLVQQIRSRYHENQYDLSNREKILYGRTGAVQPGSLYPEPELEQPHPSSLFRVRLLMALLLFGLVVARILEAISADYEDTLNQWIETMSVSGK